MRVLIVEDEVIIAAELSDILIDMGYTICGIAINYSNAITFLESEKPDIALVDINLGGSNTGIDVGKYINSNNKIPFIYLTSLSDKETIDNALTTKPSAYLTKPFSKALIYSSFELALNNYAQTNLQNPKQEELVINNAIFVKEKDIYVKVPLDEIYYFKSDKNYIEAVTAKKKYIIRSTFLALLTGIINDSFFRIHKSFAVNKSKIQSINHAKVILFNSEELPLGESYRLELMQKIQRFN